MQVHGGYGYSTEFEVERLYRDAPLMSIGEGTNDILRTVIAKSLLKGETTVADDARWLARSALYVPGDAPDKLRRALDRGADELIVDLEDAVAPADKAMARDVVATWLDGRARHRRTGLGARQRRRRA